MHENPGSGIMLATLISVAFWLGLYVVYLGVMR